MKLLTMMAFALFSDDEEKMPMEERRRRDRRIPRCALKKHRRKIDRDASNLFN